MGSVFEHSEIGLSQGIGVLVCLLHIMFFDAVFGRESFLKLGSSGLERQ